MSSFSFSFAFFTHDDDNDKQGDLTQQEKRAVFLTVHDLGCNREWEFNLFHYESECLTCYVNNNWRLSSS